MDTMLFDLYRYQIIPAQTQMNLLYDLNKVIAKKNEYFEENLKTLKSIKNKQLQFGIEREIDDTFIAIVSRQKRVPYYTEEHKRSQIPSYPPAYIIFDNDKEHQIIAIEKNNYYQSSCALVKQFLKGINGLLEDSHLLVKIAPIYQAKSFWEYVNTHKDEIKKVKFSLITPNMSNISRNLSEQITENAKLTKAAETEFSIKADGESCLIIEEDNKQLVGMVDYTSNGGGETFVHLKGAKAKYKSNDYQLHFEIDELTFKGNASDLIKQIRRVVDGATR